MSLAGSPDSTIGVFEGESAPGGHHTHDKAQELAQPARHDSKVDDNQTAAHGPGGAGGGKESREDGDVGEGQERRRQHQATAHDASTHLPAIDTTIAREPLLTQRGSHHASPATYVALHLQTDMDPAQASEDVARTKETPIIFETTVSPDVATLLSIASPQSIPGASSSLRSNLSTSSMASSLSPGSALPSPFLSAMSDLTPLPSPLVGSDSLGPWRSALSGVRGRSRGSSLNDTPPLKASLLSTSPESPSKKKKGYGNLVQEATMANAAAMHENARISRSGSSSGGARHHSRHRSISDFKPETLQNVRQRHVTFGAGDADKRDPHEYHMQREAYLAAQRGLTAPPVDLSKQLPTPPPSTSSVAESDEADEEAPFLEDGSTSEYLEIHCGIHNKRRKFRQLRQLGQGTFSKVMLATRQRVPAHPTLATEATLDPHRLVAVKIVEHGPAGGADAERIETGLKREVEMLKSVSHASLIHLRACEYQDTRTLLVLTYCPGGDLFELASEKRDVLTPPMIQRMFAELVSAVRYLHSHMIVHRDVKLENVLVNLRADVLQTIADPITHPTPIITLTDLGLSRRVPQPPESPLLTTRCGSEDYAAPEILLGQPYDGRLTDAWALGVLLYALMEGRLPFDAPPGKPDRSRNTHRIARCDWIWCRFGDDDGEWDASRARDWEGARLCVEGLLKKVRMGRKPLEDVEGMAWVQQGIRVPGGLRVRDEDEDEL